MIVHDQRDTLWRVTKRIQWTADKPTRPFEVDIVEGLIGNRIIGAALILCWFGLLWTAPERGLVISIIPFWALIILALPMWWLSKRYYPWVSIAIGPFTFFHLPINLQRYVLLSVPLLLALNWYLGLYWRIVVETAPGVGAERWEGYVRGPKQARAVTRAVREHLVHYGTPEDTPAVFVRTQ